MPTLTVFTPAYNRAHTLGRTYESLLAQTNKDFVWSIIDDGSKDNTKDTVEDWIKKTTEFEIRYFYKENGGLHTAYNLAIEKADTELSVCIDSDDYMPDNAVELILNCWKINGCDKYAGITGLDFNAKNGEVVGGRYPDNLETINLADVAFGKYPKSMGDKKHVVRTQLYKQVAPMKVFEGEKNFNPHYMHMLISRDYDFLVLNENLCFVDYQEDGMTGNMYWQYYNSPNSFAEIRRLRLSFDSIPFKYMIRQCIHYDSSCILAKQKNIVKNCPKKFWALMCMPFGFVLSRLILYKNRKRENEKGFIFDS